MPAPTWATLGIERIVDARATGAGIDAPRPADAKRVLWLADDVATPPTNAVAGVDYVDYDNEPPPYTSDDLASQAEAEAGEDNTKLMTALRTAQAIAALGAGGGGVRGDARLDIADAWYPSATGGNANSTLTQDRCYAVAYEVPFDLTLSDLGVWVSTAVASATLRVGVAANDDAGQPGTVLFEAGGLDASATGFKKASGVGAVSVGLSSGDIVFLLLSGQVAAGVQVPGVQSFDVGRAVARAGTDPVSSNPGGALVASGFAGSYGASLAGTIWTQNAGAPLVYLKRS